VFEIKALREIFDLTERRRLPNEEFTNLYSSLDIIRAINQEERIFSFNDTPSF
jgi:hypothetical protein